MSLDVPTRYVQPDILAWSGGRPIRDVEWLEQLGRMHHLYSRQGATVPLWESEEPFETTSVALTQTNDNALGLDLSQVQGAIKLVRPGTKSGLRVYYIEVGAYLDAADLVVDVVEYETGLAITSIVLESVAPAMVRESVVLSLAESSVGEDVSAPTRTLVLVPRVRATGPSGRMLHAHAREQILTATEIPVRAREVVEQAVFGGSPTRFSVATEDRSEATSGLVAPTFRVGPSSTAISVDTTWTEVP